MELTLDARTAFIAMSGLLLVATACCFGVAAGRIALVRQPRPLEGLNLGDRVPRLRLRTPTGVALQVPDESRRTLLVFADSRCQSCFDLVPAVDAFMSQAGQATQVVVITPGGARHAARFAEEAGLRAPIVGDEGLIASTYRVNVSPIACLVESDGRIAAMTRPEAHAVPDLMDRLRRAAR